MSNVKTTILTFFLRQTLASFLCILLFSSSFLCGQQNTKDSLVRHIKKIRSYAAFSQNDSLHIDLLNALGRELRYYHSDSLLQLSHQCLEYSQASEYKRGECQALLGLGDYYSDKGAHDKSILYHQSALSLSLLLENSELILEAQNNLGLEHFYKGDYAKSLAYYLEGLDLAKVNGNSLMLSIMNENVASLYASQKDFKQALEFYKKVKKINDEIGNEVYAAETMSNIASVYADMGELEYAMFNANSSISVFEKHKIMDWLAYAYEIKGKTYLKKNKFKWALYWYKQSEMLHENLEDARGKIDLLNGMAEAFLGLQNDSMSEKYALEAFEISNTIQFVEGTQKCARTLYKINKNKNNFEVALQYHEVYQTLSDTLSRNENKKGLTMLKTKIEHDKQKADLIEENRKQLATQQSYVNASLAILLIFIVVTILVRRNEKIQKNLNIELKEKTGDLEKSEQELRENNRTKDKLFSIIAHDLRGPIGAFQSLLKLLKEGEIEQHEFIEFIPKLRHDIDHISFTLNNLLSWGQAQMNGVVTKPTNIAIDSMVEENIHFLSEIAENKSIKLSSRLIPNTIAWSDENQINIVLRNLISNALKFTPQNGMVTITSLEKVDYWQISVRDSGVGMDRDTIDKLFTDSSNITTYGTNNEKGTGLGLSLCKEMVERNHGTIWVESIPRKGSTFHFTIPKSKKKYKKTA